MAYAKLNDDRAFVRTSMPTTATELTVNNITGWSYEITCEYGKRYSLFLYFDGARYQVKCVFPEVEGKFTDIHEHHLFPDGRICLDPNGGVPTIGDAYAKSVIWANGWSVFEMTQKFPFAIGH
jgi:hypothetical protein